MSVDKRYCVLGTPTYAAAAAPTLILVIDNDHVFSFVHNVNAAQAKVFALAA